VALDEGVRDQTRRHALLIALLGIRQVIVAGNKIDLVDFSRERFEAAALEVQQLLSSLSIEHLNIIPISAARGDNMASLAASTPWYDGPPLIEAIESLAPAPPERLPARFAIQDSYAIDGRTCLAGRVLAGRIGETDSLTVYPTLDTVTGRLHEVDADVAPQVRQGLGDRLCQARGSHGAGGESTPHHFVRRAARVARCKPRGVGARVARRYRAVARAAHGDAQCEGQRGVTACRWVKRCSAGTWAAPT
jgi:hypothetical protein